MFSRRVAVGFTILTLVATGSIVFAQKNSVPASKGNESPSVSVKSFWRGNVIGYLEHPLGTIVRVTGACVDGSFTRMKADAGRTLLRIETVNGRNLQRPVILPFHRAVGSVPKPAPGERFDYYVHEYGGFDGVVDIPKGLGIPDVIVQNNGFNYEPAITIHKSLAVQATQPLPVRIKQ